MASIPARRLRSGQLLTYALLGLWSLVCLFPLYWLAVTSLKGEAAIVRGPFFLPFADFTPTFDSWAFILADPHDTLVWSYLNSLAVGIVSTALTMLFAGLAVFGMRIRRTRCQGRGLLAAIMATRILPPVTLVLPVYVMAQVTGTLDTRFALICTYTALNLPVAVWLLQSVFGEKASEQEDAAELDGASYLSIFFTIAVPMAATGIAAAALLIFVLCWNEYLFAAYLAGDHAMTLPPYLVGQMSIREAQVGSEAEEWARFSASTLLIALPPLAGIGLAQRALRRMGQGH